MFCPDKLLRRMARARDSCQGCPCCCRLYLFSPSHFLQLSACFPREISPRDFPVRFPRELEKGPLSLFSQEEAVLGCEMARGMKPFTLSGAESHIPISAVYKPISSTGKTQKVAKTWSCSQARSPREKTGNI